METYKSKMSWYIRLLCLLLAATLLFMALPTPVKALAGFDDIAIIAALLAGAGISVLSYSATQTMLEGLGGKLDAYGATQGYNPGAFAEYLVNKTKAIGFGLLSLAREGWEALMGFVNWLKTPSGGGLSVQTPIISGYDMVVIYGVSYPVNKTKPANFDGAAKVYPTSIYYENGVASGVYFGGGTRLLFMNSTASSLYGFYGYINSSGYRYGSSGAFSDWQKYGTYQGRAVPYCALWYENGYLVIGGWRAGSWQGGVVSLNNNLITQTEWQINDDNFDLSYLNDAVGDVYMRLGNIEGQLDTLEGIATAVQDAYDSSYADTGVGTITSTAYAGENADTLDELNLPRVGAAMASRFPWSIPWDIYGVFQLLSATAEVPRWEIDFTPVFQGMGLNMEDEAAKVVIDMSEFEIVGQVSRWVCMVGFIIALALGTRKMIWK